MNIGNPSPIARDFMRDGYSKSCPIIDMHGHFGPFHGGYLPSADVEKFRSSLTRAGVKRIVCSSHDALFVDVEYGNAALQEAVEEYPDSFLGYWSVNPNNREATSRAGSDYERARGFVGFKFLPDYHTYPLTGSRYSPALEYANEHCLVVLVHTWGDSAYNNPFQVAEAAEKYPRINFLMGHSGFGDWENSVRIARDYSNVYLELTAVYVAHDFGNQPSGSGTPSPLLSYLQVNGIIEYMAEHASSKKIVFGTDMPWYSPYYAAGAVLFAHIDDDARHDILHGNAERLIGRFLAQL